MSLELKDAEVISKGREELRDFVKITKHSVPTTMMAEICLTRSNGRVDSYVGASAATGRLGEAF